jgi:hypothetical protein
MENKGEVGVYRTFWAMLDRNDPLKAIRVEDDSHCFEANPELTKNIQHQIYLNDVVFHHRHRKTGDDFIVASVNWILRVA